MERGPALVPIARASLLHKTCKVSRLPAFLQVCFPGALHGPVAGHQIWWGRWDDANKWSHVEGWFAAQCCFANLPLVVLLLSLRGFCYDVARCRSCRDNRAVRAHGSFCLPPSLTHSLTRSLSKLSWLRRAQRRER